MLIESITEYGVKCFITSTEITNAYAVHIVPKIKSHTKSLFLRDRRSKFKSLFIINKKL